VNDNDITAFAAPAPASATRQKEFSAGLEDVLMQMKMVRPEVWTIRPQVRTVRTAGRTVETARRTVET
jgi:hypothetical protein